jgi:hypothetical protein
VFVDLGKMLLSKDKLEQTRFGSFISGKLLLDLFTYLRVHRWGQIADDVVVSKNEWHEIAKVSKQKKKM